MEGVHTAENPERSTGPAFQSQSQRERSQAAMTPSTLGAEAVTEAHTGLFPVFLKLQGRSCLVVGAGNVALSKIEGLLVSGAEVRVVAPRAVAPVITLAQAGKISWWQRSFEPADLDGVFLAVVATSTSELNGRVFQEAQR